MNVLHLENFEVKVDAKVRSKVKTMNICAGDISALVGKNGSGKSSLLSGIMTLPGYSAIGTCMYLGIDVKSTTLDQKARGGMLYIAQKQPEIEGLSLIQLLYGMYKRTVDKPMSIVEYKNELTLKLKTYSLKSELLLRPIGVGLSGGEKKQAELITLVATMPKLALVDEIDSGVDINTLGSIAMIVKALQESGSSVLIVSHNFEFLEKIQPTQVYLAHEGVVSYHGEAGTLKKLKESGLVLQ